MRINSLSLLFALVCIAIAVQAAPPNVIQQSPEPYLEPSSWDRIVSTEHTEGYLAKTGGLAEPTGYGGYTYPNVAGNWSFELRDAKSRPVGKVELRLFQAGNLVFGKGALEVGLKQQSVTAVGSLTEGNAMALDLVGLENVNLYRLSIGGNANGSATSGTFKAFSPAGGEPMTGTIEGGRNEPRGFS